MEDDKIKKLTRKSYQIPLTDIDLRQREEGNINLEIVKLLAQGIEIRDIPTHLQLKHFEPNSLSIVEKRLNALKKVFKCDTLFQLMYEIGARDLI